MRIPMPLPGAELPDWLKNALYSAPVDSTSRIGMDFTPMRELFREMRTGL